MSAGLRQVSARMWLTRARTSSQMTDADTTTVRRRPARSQRMPRVVDCGDHQADAGQVVSVLVHLLQRHDGGFHCVPDQEPGYGECPRRSTSGAPRDDGHDRDPGDHREERAHGIEQPGAGDHVVMVEAETADIGNQQQAQIKEQHARLGEQTLK